MTELQSFKKKCLNEKGNRKQNVSEADWKRMKQLQDAEPVSANDIKEAEKRETSRLEKDRADFKARQQEKSNTTGDDIATAPQPADPALDKQTAQEHPRIVTLKSAIEIFSKIQFDPSRDDSTVLIVRGVSITAGDVKKAIEAMKI